MPRSAGVKTKVERAAVDLFAANGFDGVSVADIAAAAGVSQGALYRHYRSKHEFGAAVTAIIAHFCALFDEDPAVFRFMLITQHGFLPRIASGSRTPVDAVADLVGDAVAKNRLKPIDPALGAAVIMGVILQSATFHIYGRLGGSLGARARGLARAAIPAVAAITQ